MQRRRLAVAGMLTFSLIALASCSSSGSGQSEGVGTGGPGGGPLVVATTTILGDVVEHVVGGDGVVEVLVPTGVDPHDYQASSRQVAMLQDADLVVANGLGLEEGLEDVLETAAADGANVIELAPRLDPIPFAAEHDSGDASTDPHVWMDPVRMADAALLVAVELGAIDESADWSGRAATYADELAAAHREIEATLGAIPPERRKLVTNHDSLGYFADRYGFDVVGVVIPGGTTLAEPSSAELARLVADIERSGAPAIFAETTDSSVLAEAVAAEISRPVAVVELYTGSLGEPGSGAETLIGMLKLDAARIAAALA